MAKLAHLIRDLKRRRMAEKYRRAHGDDFTAYGLAVTVPPLVDANIRYLLARGRDYEAEEAAFIQNVLRPGVHVIELGGSLGVISRVIRQAIGADAHHIVVEANPDLAKICEENAARDAAPGATEVLQAAVAYTDAPTIAFARGDTHHTGHVAQAGGAGTFEAPAMKLAALRAKLPSGAPWALVSDIEGGELDMFMREPPEIFAHMTHAILEIHPEAFTAMGSSEAAFMGRLNDIGLTLLERQADVILLKGRGT